MGINVIYSMMKTLEYIYIEDNHEYFIDNKGVVLFKNKKNYKCSKIKINENEIVMLLNDGNVDTWEKDE
ncbi:hypothetical protein P381_22265 [Salmonella enterica subsp. enterica serovar Enteritidis str. 10-34587]|nr:hypothetical protein P381_22265 [Salmonella enterica subsp. enterica serovar Enteritidis str. 10-34587]